MDLTPCPEGELYWNIASAEVNSRRWGGRYVQHLTPRLLDLVRRGKRDQLSPAEMYDVRRAVRFVRGPLVEPLERLGISWFMGAIPTKQIGEIRLMRHGPFTAYARSRTIGEFVQKLDAGHPLVGDEPFEANYRQVRPEFVFAKVVGRPVLLAVNEPGPYTELEGLTRLCVYVSKSVRHEAVPASVEILLGVSDRVAEWRWY